MRALVVFESMFGNTRVVAEGIARGLGDAPLLGVADAGPEALAGIDLLVVGGPTHVHGMVSERSRTAAIQQAQEHGSDLALDPGAEAGPTLRDWLDGLSLAAGCRVAAFDTRMHGPAPLTGRASRGIAKRLERHGATLIAPPESFIVERDNTLAEGESERAQEWGASLVRTLVPA